MAVPSYDRLAQEDSPAGDASAHADLRSIPRPAVYYGEGPFDAPDSDEEETFLEKPQSPRLTEDAREMDDIDEELGLYVGGHRQRWSSIRWLVILLGCLVAFAALIGLSAALSYKGPVRVVRGTQPITMDHIFNGTFYPEQRSLAWIPEAGDGVYSIIENDWIVLVDLKNNSTRKLVHKDALKDKDGKPLTWSSWKLSADMKYVLVKTDHLKQWRHSSFGNYYVLELQTNKTRPLTTPEHPPTVSYAAWSPTGDSIAFVKSNDLYVLPTPSAADDPIRVTSTGNATLFHGVPDWVYEEEVFAADFALWWSPDSSKVAFLTSDETDVHSYVFPVYNPSSWNNMAIEPYTTDVRMRYPKPGYPNPRVSAHIFDVSRFLADRVFDVEAATLELDWGGRLPYNDSVIMEITWLDNVNLLIKEVSRNADRGSVVLFDLSLSTSTGQVVRSLGKNGEEGDDGWIEASQTVHPLPSSLLQDGTSGYLDIVPTKDGFNHIALFSPADSSTPRFLTTGEWEVTGGIAAVDPDRRLVYYQAATPASTQRHIYSIPLPSLDGLTPQSDMEIAPPTALSETDSAGYYSASFSPRGAFYLLSYEGPNIPWQQVVYAGEPEKSFILTNNTALNATWSGFQMPIVQYSTIVNDGYELNAVEIRPPHMDDSGRTKYPVLFRVYGGPNSQLVSQKFSIDWHYYLACSLQYIIVVVDGRGTGLKGRKLRNPVKSNLGYWETKDQIEAARIWASKDYVDPRRIGIWGWSYGGYMSLKVVEADAGIHTLAMSVAPPTDWRMYDTIYTERYMNLPQLNEEGYANSSVSNVTAFDKVDFALAHGSADDNVHFANTAHLLDLFTAAQIRKYRFRMFTDSDHSISKRGAYRELHEYLTTFLLEKWGKGGRRRGW